MFCDLILLSGIPHQLHLSTPLIGKLRFSPKIHKTKIHSRTMLVFLLPCLLLVRGYTRPVTSLSPTLASTPYIQPTTPDDVVTARVVAGLPLVPTPYHDLATHYNPYLN